MTETTTTKTRSRRTPEQLAADYQAKANRARAVINKKKRSDETRRKVIAGASLLGLVEVGDEDAKRVLAKIHAGLTRPQDRVAFGLPEKTLDELSTEIDDLVARNKAATTKEEKKATAAKWRVAVVTWEKAAGKAMTFGEKTREQMGLGGIGEILPGF